MFPPVLPQAAPDRTGVYVAVGVLALFAAIGLYFLVTSRLDEARGVNREEAIYVLGRGEHPDLLRVQGEVVPTTTHQPGRKGLKELVLQVERRNDMGVEYLVLEDGNQVPYVTAKGSLDQIASAIITDSRTTIQIDRDGRVTAQPPLDEATRRDLQELLVQVIEPETEVP